MPEIVSKMFVLPALFLPNRTVNGLASNSTCSTDRWPSKMKRSSRTHRMVVGFGRWWALKQPSTERKGRTPRLPR